MPLAPEAKTLLDMVYRVGAPRFHDLSVAQARHSFEKMQFAFRPEAPAVGGVTEVPIPRPDGSVLLARHYRPANHTAEHILPLVIYLHGGGWCVGDVASYDVLCRELANASGCAVLSVDYRLAPEHPFPAAVRDAQRALDWAVEHADLLAADPKRIALAGDSAGGNLSLVTALACRDRGESHIAFVLTVYPCTEIHSQRASRQRYANGYLLDEGSLRWFFEKYLPQETGQGQGEDWRASPMRAQSLAGLPPMWMLVAEYDPLIDDCLAFAERLQAEGGQIVIDQVEGMVHGFFTLGRLFPQAREALSRAAQALRQALAA